ncbi:hypothetical protein [Roseibium album]|uniref:hypothetical protein n=1 Tax=Roseibium album TaxID=311410 RepID=UPI003918843D
MLSRPGKLSDPLAFAAGFAVLFGVLTILSGGTALFSSEDIRSNFGDVVQTVLWFSFVSGFWYVLTGLGLWARRYWAVQSSVLLLLAILAVFAYLGVHILDGGAFEMRTVVAMTFRTFCWSLISMMAVKLIPHR